MASKYKDELLNTRMNYLAYAGMWPSFPLHIGRCRQLQVGLLEQIGTQDYISVRTENPLFGEYINKVCHLADTNFKANNKYVLVFGLYFLYILESWFKHWCC